MTRVTIHPGACGHVTELEVINRGDEEVTITVNTGCASVRGMFDALGNTFDGYALCLNKPGCGIMYTYASEHFPSHCGCPVIAGVVKSVEVACNLAIAHDVSITFEE